jgi:hypothetical protein
MRGFYRKNFRWHAFPVPIPTSRSDRLQHSGHEPHRRPKSLILQDLRLNAGQGIGTEPFIPDRRGHCDKGGGAKMAYP